MIETVTQQEMGEEVFFPREDAPLFTCGEGNNSFRQAMLDARYREAEGVISVAFDCGAGSCEGGTVVKELPILSGRVTLPQALPEFSPPEGNELVSYSFGGWTESMDEANLVRKPGSEFTVGDRETLYFIASWPQKALLEIKRERDGEDMVFSVPEIESFTENYVLTSFCWQTCVLAAGEEPPENQDLLPWEDIPGETGQTYRRAMGAGDENRLFRCKITVEKKQQGFSLFSLFSATEEEELSLAAVRGAVYAAEGQYTVTCSPGEYTAGDGTKAAAAGTDQEAAFVAQGDYVVIPDCPYTMDKQENDVIVFNGWKDSDENNYDPGQIVQLDHDLTLTAQWAAATISYVDGTKSYSTPDLPDGTASKPYGYFYNSDSPNAYDNFPDNGTKYTNIVVVMGNTTLGTGDYALGEKDATITSRDPASGTMYDCTLTLSGNVSLQGNTRFEDLKWTAVKEASRLFANSHQVTMGQGLTMTNEYQFELYGEGGEVIVQSGDYRCVHGGKYTGDITGDTKVEISGNADVGVACGAGWSGSSVVTGNTQVLISGEARAAAVVGGNRSSDSDAGVTGSSFVMVGGNARIRADNNTVNEDTQFSSSGFVAGSGADPSFTTSAGNVRSGTHVEIRENAVVEGNVMGGSGDGWVDQALADSNQDSVENYYALTDTVGGTNVLITGNAQIKGSVFGGSSNRSCSGDTAVIVESGAISGSVYGGGLNGSVSGSSTVTISGGAISGNVYGGTLGAVSGSNLPNSDSSAGFDAAACLVMGDSRVEINGAGGLTIGGGVLGSGELTCVQGTRYVTIESYNGGLTTLQHIDLLKLSNSTVTIQGEDDLSDEYADKPFSITQVQDMRLYNSDLTLLAEARALGALSNCDATLGGDTALHPSVLPSARTGLATDEATRSTVQLKPGLLLQVRYVSDSGDTTYGPVSGVFWLKMSEPAAEDLGVRVEASYDSDTGAFLPDPETAEFVSSKVSTSYSRWRLGGTTLLCAAVLTAALTEDGAENTVQSDWIDLPTSEESTVYEVTNVVFEGEFNLVKPLESGTGIALPAFDETQKQHAGNTFSLWVDPVGDGWQSTGSETAQWGPYLLTELPEGETSWNSGVEGVWKRGDGTALLYTEGAGANGQVQFSLLYNGGYESFSGGTVEVTLKEFPSAGKTAGDELNTVKILLTLAKDKSGSYQSAWVARGRTFNDMPEEEAVAISARGAVTAEFLTEYYPSTTGASDMYLHLCSEDGTEVAFPSGAGVVLGDRSTAGQYQYYYCVSQGKTGLCLEDFTNLSDANTGYPGPSDVTNALTERLRFVVDFSSAADQLSQGSYYLALTHQADQSLTEKGVAEAAFSITSDGTPSLQLTQNTDLSAGGVWALTVTTQVPAADTRYENGASIRLSLQLPDGTSAGFPNQLSIRALGQDGEELSCFSGSAMWDRSGSVSFTLPKNSVSTVLLDFSDVPDTVFSNGAYVLRANMSPQVGLQVCSDSEKDAGATLGSLVMERNSTAARSVYLSMENDTDRLVDAAEGPAQMNLSLKCENLLDSDILTVEILRKTCREEPHDSSYAPVENQSQWGIAPASGTAAGEWGNTLTVTVPQGQASGTYRIKIVVESGGKVVIDTEQVYNFIVK